MVINEHERPSNFTPWTQINVKKQQLYCCSRFHSNGVRSSV